MRDIMMVVTMGLTACTLIKLIKIEEHVKKFTAKKGPELPRFGFPEPYPRNQDKLAFSSARSL